MLFRSDNSIILAEDNIPKANLDHDEFPLLQEEEEDVSGFIEGGGSSSGGSVMPIGPTGPISTIPGTCMIPAMIPVATGAIGMGTAVPGTEELTMNANNPAVAATSYERITTVPELNELFSNMDDAQKEKIRRQYPHPEDRERILRILYEKIHGYALPDLTDFSNPIPLSTYQPSQPPQPSNSSSFVNPSSKNKDIIKNTLNILKPNTSNNITKERKMDDDDGVNDDKKSSSNNSGGRSGPKKIQLKMTPGAKEKFMS